MKEITEKDIRDLAPKRIVERGYGYFEKEYVSNPIAFKERLVAEVIGRKNYITRVDFIKDEIETSCTCPYDGLVCKHAIALLYTLLYKRENFINFERIEEKLLEKKKIELVELIEKIISSYPKLARFLFYVEDVIDSKIYKNHVNRLLEGYYEYDEVFSLASELREILDVLDSSKSGEVLEILDFSIHRLIGVQENVDDSSGALADITSEFIRLYSKLMRSEKKKRFFEKYLKLYLEDEWGFSDDLMYLLIESCKNKKELRELRKLVEIELESKRSEEKGDLGILLISIYDKLGENEKFLDFCTSEIQETKDEYYCDLLYERLIEKLIEMRRYDEALSYSKKASKRDTSFLEYSAKILEKKDIKKALNTYVMLFKSSPHFHFETLFKIKQISAKLDRWNSIKEEIIKFLEKSKDHEELIRIGLIERDLKLCLNYSKDCDLELLEEISELADERDEEKAIQIHKEIVEIYVGKATRKNYKKAKKHILKLKKLMKKNFSSYLNAIKDKHPRKSALLDELKGL